MGHILYKKIPIIVLGQSWQVDVGTNALCFYKIGKQTPTFDQDNNKNINYLEKNYILMEKFVGFVFRIKRKIDITIHNSAYIKYIYTVILNKQQWDPETHFFIEKNNGDDYYYPYLKVWAAGLEEDF